METFKYIDKFNEELQRKIRTLELNVEIESYEDLKKNPKKYMFCEWEDHISFILKNREKDGKTLESFMIFEVFAREKEVDFYWFVLYKYKLEFIKKAAAKENWSG